MPIDAEYIRAYRQRKMDENPEWYTNHIQTIRECQRKTYAAKREALGFVMGVSRCGRHRKARGEIVDVPVVAGVPCRVTKSAAVAVTEPPLA